MSHSEDNKRIAKNALFLYGRSFITLVVSLYTSRVILQALGFEDYGIYSLVGSVVVMFNMFSATFTSSTQRFLNIALGKGEPNHVRDVFSASLSIYTILSIAILILLETVGLWFLNTQLTIPENRMIAANWVYQLSIATFVLNLISLPYNAVIIANEKMDVFAYVSIYEVIMKLAIVYLLAFSPIDTLIWYSILLFLVMLSIRIFYGLYCGRCFNECHYKKVSDFRLYKEILTISGWNFFGSGATILTTNSIGIIVNMFSNVIINSSKGIAGKLENVVSQLFNNFTIALRPQITKAYAAEDYEYMQSLVSRGSRYSVLLLCFLCFPLIAFAEPILRLWLGDIPQYAPEFVQLTMIYLIQNGFSTILDIVLMATGRIKYSQITLSILQLLNLPLSFILLYTGLPPYAIYISFIAISYLSLIARIYFVVHYTTISYRFYFNRILFPMVMVFLVSVILSYGIYKIPSPNMFVLAIKVFLIEAVLIGSFMLMGAEKSERKAVFNRIYNYIKR